jgi:hypothetical protein
MNFNKSTYEIYDKHPLLSTIISIVLIWYAISFIFLLNPLLLHKYKNKLPLTKKPNYSNKDDIHILGKGSPYLFAHRGGSFEAPENTLQSFLHSVEVGVDVIETDVRITKD